MSSISSSIPESARTSRWQWARYHLRRNPLVTVGLIIAVLWIVLSLLSPSIAPFPPLQQDLANRLLPPGSSFFMGTDELGRDIFSRVLWGGRITIPAGLAVILIGSSFGTIIGAIAGYAGGIVDEILMRLTELFMAFPFIILAMAVTAALGPDIKKCRHRACHRLVAPLCPHPPWARAGGQGARVCRGSAQRRRQRVLYPFPHHFCPTASPPPSSSPPSISALPSSASRR